MALRLWAPKWESKRIRLSVTSDNVSALIMVVKMRASGQCTSLIARELALDIADALYEPLVVSHVPGIANILADWLSRKRARGDSRLPAALRHARCRTLPHRGGAWWRTL